ncbi:hypothetical protein LR48_Vigan511s000600 [Vigna angularis]|uniref:Uncharacterized protein n=1 Tax=Phaseolus angularis TaxID=3914 RepID=A0A0L9TCB6_PHAAN|nr:hypothetical protein LR48_Vigan511s000600 [Vigna angularis]
MEGPMVNSNHNKKKTNYSDFYNRRKSITIIKTIYLGIPTINLTILPNFDIKFHLGKQKDKMRYFRFK